MNGSNTIKLLVFAHVPPPHHGQSYMVKLMLEGLGGNCRSDGNHTASHYGIECYHINARLSKQLEDIGDVHVGKVGLLLWYCLKAIWYRFRFGVKNFYYIPAPGKSSALIRDMMVMALCRPFFDRIILHWHAAGMAKWLESSQTLLIRDLVFRTLGQPDLCIVLSHFNYQDAAKLWPKRICVVSNGIPDPCPDFHQSLRATRLARYSVRTKLLAGEKPTADEVKLAGDNPSTCRILYLAHATETKGLYDCIEGVRLAARHLRGRNMPINLQLTIAGDFINTEEKERFDALLQEPELQNLVTYRGFVSGEHKAQAFRKADLFCFPTYYPNENQPVNLIEAIAWGVPVVTTRWRSVPELFPEDYNGLATPRSPEQVCEALLEVMKTRSGVKVRKIFEESYRLDRHLDSLTKALRTIESEQDARPETIGHPMPQP